MNQAIEVYSDSDLELFRDALNKLFSEQDGAAAIRSMRQPECDWDFHCSTWQGVCEHGLLPSPVDAFDWSTLPLLSEVFRSMGEKLVTLPLLESIVSHVLLSSVNLSLNDFDEASLADGRQRIVPIQIESNLSGSDCSNLSLRAGRLSGSCEGVFTRSADGFLVLAKADAGVALALVPASNVEQEYLGVGLDGSRKYRLQFKDIELSDGLCCTDSAAVLSALESVSVIANILLAAQLQGLSEAAFSRTMEWLKTREQFGVLIGSFQALQHRAVRCFLLLEKMKALNTHNLTQINGVSGARQAIESKVFAAASATALTAEAIQMHGGIGMTDECDIGFYYKAAHTLAHRYGGRDRLLQQITQDQ